MVNKLWGISGLLLVIALLGSTVVFAGWGFNHKIVSDEHRTLFKELKESNASPEEWKAAMAELGFNKTKHNYMNKDRSFHKKGFKFFPLFGLKDKFSQYRCVNK